jgi:hypothetical protein
MFIPDPNFFHPGSASKKLNIFTQQIVSKLSEIRSELFIPDPDFFTNPGSQIQGSKRHRIPDPDPQHLYSIQCKWYPKAGAREEEAGGGEEEAARGQEEAGAGGQRKGRGLRNSP